MSIPALSPVPSLAADPRPLPLSAKLLYGVGEMPITVLMFLSGIFLLFFYKTVMGLPPALAGLGLSASLVLDAVLEDYVVEDYGSALIGKYTIDLYKSTRGAMNAWGVRYVHIEVTELGSYKTSLAVLLPRQRWSHVRQMVAGLKTKA